MRTILAKHTLRGGTTLVADSANAPLPTLALDEHGFNQAGTVSYYYINEVPIDIGASEVMRRLRKTLIWGVWRDIPYRCLDDGRGEYARIVTTRTMRQCLTNVT